MYGYLAVGRVPLQARWSAVTDLRGVESVQDRQGGLADPLPVALTTSTGSLPSTRAAQVETYGIV